LTAGGHSYNIVAGGFAGWRRGSTPDIEPDTWAGCPATAVLEFSMHILLTLILWFAAWLLWSGMTKPLLLVLGVLSCLLVLIFARRMGLLEKRVYSLRFLMRLLPFWGWLGKELVVSNLQVARIVLSRKPPISPTVIRLKALPEGPVGQAFLCNSITLTPGTVTVDEHEGELLVHCLTTEGADALLEGEMNRRVAALGKE
jgi:multicomponent Na+:H+ antiporter subunit E